METPAWPQRPGARPSTQPIQVPCLAWAAVVVALFLVYLVFQENGALLETSWQTLHEFFHDGRHALGFPCH